MRTVRASRTVYLSIIGISWFWLLGSLLLTQIPNLTRIYLNGETTVVTLILSVFTIAVATGSLACEKLSRNRIEVGIVPLGALGLSLAGTDLYYALADVASRVSGMPALDWIGFLAVSGVARLLADFALVGFFGGVFIVPMYALIQARTPEKQRARMIAVNNILNSVFMVLGAGLAILFLVVFGWAIPEFLLGALILNLAVAGYMFLHVPEFLARCVAWLVNCVLYRVDSGTSDRIPEHGGALLVSNHVTFLDPFLLAGAIKRDVTFVIPGELESSSVSRFLLRGLNTVRMPGIKGAGDTHSPSPGNHGSPERKEPGEMEEIQRLLDEGRLVCVFPEGAMTGSGKVQSFARMFDELLEADRTPVIPIALNGLWGSLFSRSDNRLANSRPFTRRVVMRVGPALGHGGTMENPGLKRASFLQTELAALQEG